MEPLMLTKDELRLLRKALLHYDIHQLGTKHPDSAKYKDMIKMIENILMSPAVE